MTITNGRENFFFAIFKVVCINLIGDDIRTIERNADVLLNACKDIGLEMPVNIGRTNYMAVERHRGMLVKSISR